MSIISILKAEGVHDIGDCLQWAFGNDAGLHTPIHGLDQRWNRLHENRFIVHPTDDLQSTIHKIAKAYISLDKEVSWFKYTLLRRAICTRCHAGLLEDVHYTREQLEDLCRVVEGKTIEELKKIHEFWIGY